MKVLNIILLVFGVVGALLLIAGCVLIPVFQWFIHKKIEQVRFSKKSCFLLSGISVTVLAVARQVSGVMLSKFLMLCNILCKVTLVRSA